MDRKRFIGAALGASALSGLGYATYRILGRDQAHTCRACARPVHGHSRTIATTDGARGAYCCPACALSEHQQSEKPVEVVELTDFTTGRPLTPKDAVIVRNSDLNPCLRHDALLSPDKQPLHSHFDRCNPSMIAFASTAAAESFAREHGGQIVPFADLASEFRR